MAKVLISLVSLQRVPNVLAIKDPFFENIDRYLFISTEEMEKIGVVEHMLDSTGIGSNNCQKIVVEADSWQDIHHELSKANLDVSNEYYINLTGGTKVMSLAVFSFFNQQNWQVSYFYFPIKKNVIQQILLDQDSIEIPITFEIGVTEYLQSYGLRIEAIDFSPPHKPQHVSRQILDFYLAQKTGSGTHQFWTITGKLRPFRGKGIQFDQTEIPGLSQLISDLSMPIDQQEGLHATEIDYLTGGWFEEWIYQEVKETLGLTTKSIARNLQINWLGRDAAHGKNELDIVFMYGNTIHVIECKAGIGKGGSINDRYTRALNQLAVLRKDMGLRVNMAFITLTTQLRDKQGEIDEALAARANVLSITILDRKNIIPGFRDYLAKL